MADPLSGLPAGSVAPVRNMGLDGNGNVQGVTLNQDLVLLASAARAATTPSADQQNLNARGVIVYLNVTAASGTGGLTVYLEGKDPASGVYFVLEHATAAITSVISVFYVLYPGSSSEGTQGWGSILPATWRIRVAHGDGSSYTYSVGASLIL